MNEEIGMKEKMIGNSLPKLLEVTNFIDRCNSVVVNAVQQISSLTCGQSSIFKSKTFNESEDKNKSTKEDDCWSIQI